jgi:hypothetical protein
MELQELKENFDNIIKKYKLSEPDKAEKISKFLTTGTQIDVEAFCKEFGMERSEGDMFIAFIMKGIKYKEENIDANQQHVQ